MRRLVMLALALFLLPAAAEAAPPAADAFVRGKVDELADLLASDKPDRLDQVRDRVREVADFSGFAERALGKTWAKLSKDERAQFQAALQELLESHYMAHPGKVFDKNKLVVQSAKNDAEGALVTATVKQKDVDIGVIVKLKKVGDGWLVRDVVLDNLSLLEDYRAQFQSYLKKKTLAELTAKLKSKAAANLAKKS
jgi:phospholipid transport system substrate-binding protein